MKNKKTLIVFLIVVLVVVMVLGFFEYKKANEPEVKTEVNISTVVVKEAEKSKFSYDYETSGNVSANSYRVGLEQIRNRVSNVYVEEGDSVEEGDVLLSLDIAGASSQLKLQRTNMEQALNEIEDTIFQLEKKKEDMQKMFEAGAVAKSKLDELINSYDSLKIKKEGIVNNIAAVNQEIYSVNSSSYIYAKKSGVVSKVKIKDNQIPSMDEYIEIISDDKPEVRVYLTQNIVKNICIGDEVKASIDDVNYSGKIKEIHSLSEMDILYPVDIELDTEESFDTVQTAKVKIPIYQNEDAILVDRKAIIHFNDEVYLYKVVDNKAVKVNVVVGETENSLSEVKSGVKVGDKIIVEGQFSVVDGENVELIKN